MWTGGHMDWKSKSGCDNHNQKQELGSTGAVWTEVQNLKYQSNWSWMQTEVQNL
jgi:hypothetical protein